MLNKKHNTYSLTEKNQEQVKYSLSKLTISWLLEYNCVNKTTLMNIIFCRHATIIFKYYFRSKLYTNKNNSYKRVSFQEVNMEKIYDV